MLRAAVIGTGSIVRFFLESIHQHPRVQAQAVWTRNSEHAAGLADDFQIPEILTSWEALKHHADIDVVYIASPNSLHAGQAVDLLAHGKHVLIEKPIASNAKEAAAVQQAARRYKKIAAEAVTTLYTPGFNALKEAVSRESWNLVQANFSQYSSRYDQLKAGSTPNVFSPDFSGGVLMDLQIYHLHLFHALFGPPAEISYHASLTQEGIDTSGLLTMRYPDKTISAAAAKDVDTEDFIQFQGEGVSLRVPHGVNAGLEAFMDKRGQTRSIVQGPLQERLMDGELDTFCRWIEEGNLEAADRSLSHSVEVMSSADSARAAAGIHFPADRHPRLP
ncbi:Gfo/Idh/MocA family protein [Alkalicoccus chagannorensis]|uniref:Gfo/Idh/MocA family protein n=1 Tax=Alkalicoccus chagannorensis TaxID=427072 RepID=UPI000425F9A5|nr:Gfo/Idh/MocA family oxidoreductase [Alkalicoccus chagannorensis]